MKTSIKSRIRGLSLVGLSLLLLVLYLAGSVQVESLHHLVHPDDYTILHSPENEKDTCHQSIYHAGLNQGCEHKSHLSSFKKCSVCDYANHSVHLFPICLIDLTAPTSVAVEEHYNSSEAGINPVYQSSRAPPLT